jgi:hypothetical protein
VSNILTYIYMDYSMECKFNILLNVYIFKNALLTVQYWKVTKMIIIILWKRNMLTCSISFHQAVKSVCCIAVVVDIWLICNKSQIEYYFPEIRAQITICKIIGNKSNSHPFTRLMTTHFQNKTNNNNTFPIVKGGIDNFRIWK